MWSEVRLVASGEMLERPTACHPLLGCVQLRLMLSPPVILLPQGTYFILLETEQNNRIFGGFLLELQIQSEKYEGVSK